MLTIQSHQRLYYTLKINNLIYLIKIDNVKFEELRRLQLYTFLNFCGIQL